MATEEYFERVKDLVDDIYLKLAVYYSKGSSVGIKTSIKYLDELLVFKQALSSYDIVQGALNVQMNLEAIEGRTWEIYNSRTEFKINY